MTEIEKLNAAFLALYSDILERDQFHEAKPLLAHYTSIQNVEAIITSNEFLLSNPLLMNDYEEVRFGLIEGDRIFRSRLRTY